MENELIFIQVYLMSAVYYSLSFTITPWKTLLPVFLFPVFHNKNNTNNSNNKNDDVEDKKLAS